MLMTLLSDQPDVNAFQYLASLRKCASFMPQVLSSTCGVPEVPNTHNRQPLNLILKHASSHFSRNLMRTLTIRLSMSGASASMYFRQTQLTLNLSDSERRGAARDNDAPIALSMRL